MLAAISKGIENANKKKKKLLKFVILMEQQVSLVESFIFTNNIVFFGDKLVNSFEKVNFCKQLSLTKTVLYLSNSIIFYNNMAILYLREKLI